MVSETPAGKPKFKGVGVRILTAVSLVLLCMAPFYVGGWLWALLVAALSARIMFEWVRMSDEAAGSLALGIALSGLLIAVIYAGQGLFVWAVGALVLTTLAAVAERYRRGKPEWTAIGVPYVILPAILIIAIRGDEMGFATKGFTQLIFIVTVVVSADIGAYFGGSHFGGPKLAPSLSPNKTWSGAVCGLVLAMVMALVAGFLIGLQPWVATLLAVPLVLLSVCGDLLESTFKRRLGVKDTGTLLPGHGGLLDRLDSLMAAVVGGAILFHIIGAWPLP